MNRALDLLLLVLILPLVAPSICVIYFLILFSSGSPVLYWSKRFGKDKKFFLMPKFRTMRMEAPEVATDELASPSQYFLRFGGFLRKTSLDELPQLYSILTGRMRFVGPRPALHSQLDLIALRESKNVHNLVPGLTGWAQINGRDENSNQTKVYYDVEYSKKRSIRFDVTILGLTLIKVFRSEGVKS
ncbi:sugar transferase [Candidatus Puniceispirillum sp.]|nr:sugar transferase [Candidatus Puniceispirillum sp.]